MPSSLWQNFDNTLWGEHKEKPLITAGILTEWKDQLKKLTFSIPDDKRTSDILGQGPFLLNFPRPPPIPLIAT